MAIHLATHTMQLIDLMQEADQGAAFRVALGQVMPAIKDAYRGADPDGGFRSHLGASVIGKKCARSIWYGWRWAKKPKFSARILRLFNRGHSEEARFIASLLSIGCQVYQQDANGNQYRISDFGGHYGGSGDGVVIGIPDLPAGVPCLAEFKTHGEKSFLKLKKEGVQVSKPEHYVQMTTYMAKMNLPYALYGAVNKNTDEYYMEIVVSNTYVSDEYTDRARTIIFMKQAPPQLPNASPGLYDCKYCDQIDICHYNAPMAHNCRTCMWAEPQMDGTWECASQQRRLGMTFNSLGAVDYLPNEGSVLSKQRQLTGCGSFHTPI
jgi:hypothetical protein